jgi:hypothetical protein
MRSISNPHGQRDQQATALPGAHIGEPRHFILAPGIAQSAAHPPRRWGVKHRQIKGIEARRSANF